MSNVNQCGNWWNNIIARNILIQKYFHEAELKLSETDFDSAFKAFVDRLSSIFSTDELKTFVSEAIINGDFIFAGRTLYGAGNKGKAKTSLSNCYILPSPEDNIESIFSVAGEMAKIFSRGGGCGVNISNLRPRNSTVHNASKTSTGAVSFMDVYNVVGETIAQNGRRGATLIGLSCEHPDIEEFLKIKQNNTKIQKANISILFTDKFMEAVRDDKDFQLNFKVKDTGEVVTKTINARDFFRRFAESQWDYAEPGALWIDKANNWNLLSGYPRDEYKIEITNPCAEFASNAYNSCNLASINLYNFVENPFTDQARFAEERFVTAVRLAVHAMDEVLDYGYAMQPLDKNRACIDDWRSIGLGVFGIADMFIALGIPYGSEEAIACIDKIFDAMQYTAVAASSERAKQKGSFKKFAFAKVCQSAFLQKLAAKHPDIMEQIKANGLRNGTLLSIAPTGTISMLFNESGGVEPYYQVSYERTTHVLEKQGKSFHINMLAVNHLLKFNNIDPENIKSSKVKAMFPYVVDTYDINPFDRIKMQSTMQVYVDNAISSTLNLKESSTPEDIFTIYMQAWESGCKGITIFRDNCKRISILGTDHGNSTAKINAAKQNGEKKIQLNSLTPLKRNNIKVLDGKTFVYHTACVPKFYVTVNHLNGNIFEIFAGISGGCQANINTITRLTSYALRLGGKVEDVVEELNSAVCPACTTVKQRGDTTVNKSCASCFADAIEAMQLCLKGDYGKLQEQLDSSNTEIIDRPPKNVEMVKVKEIHNGKMKCPKCGQYTLIPDGKCAYCNNCGYSRCD